MGPDALEEKTLGTKPLIPFYDENYKFPVMKWFTRQESGEQLRKSHDTCQTSRKLTSHTFWGL